jgi:hypothetical protein
MCVILARVGSSSGLERCTTCAERRCDHETNSTPPELLKATFASVRTCALAITCETHTYDLQLHLAGSHQLQIALANCDRNSRARAHHTSFCTYSTTRS